MPVYDYECENGHSHERLMPHDNKEYGGECPDCGSQLKYTFKGRGKVYDPDEGKKKDTGVKVTYRYGKPKHVFHFRDAVCNDCGEESFVDCTDLETNDYSRENVSCEHCGSKDLKIMPACHNIDRFSERFPYYDRGLGVMLQSKAHRREVMRKMGVSAVDGDIDMEADYKKVLNKQEADAKVLQKMKHDLKHHPGYKEYRKMQDRGWKPQYKHRRQR